MEWIEKHKFTTIAIIMLIIWFSIFSLFWIKSDEITKDPCSICSEKLGEDFTCLNNDLVPIEKRYYQNGSKQTQYFGLD
jgi:hypothetical protein